MSNIRHLNQGGNPFWDFLTSIQNEAGSDHPFFNAYTPESREPRGPPPEYGTQVPDPATPPPPESHPSAHQGPHDGPRDPFDGNFFPFPFGPGRRGPPQYAGPHGHGPPHGGRGGWGWGSHRGRGGYRGRGDCHSGPDRSTGNNNGLPNFGGFDMSKLAEFIAQFAPNEVASAFNTTRESDTAASKDFTPEADVFDTEDAYIVHVSLPGAKKEDVGVNWDNDKSELSIAGVIYRPGEEEFLKTLALDERKVGVFERKVKLGTKEKPAAVDDENIGAKMEDGILRVTIPKTEGFVDIKKVDIE